ncbi:unnamed protein product [Gongylonema pulchrum]|uniref:MFS domain-containing protein n=1 Tax=Gongylonema pulchrum TaxID=637853 RepID=A0A3P6QTX3_9BILA|nr:unnamed protein product [Gongylonema pulchrum]
MTLSSDEWVGAWWLGFIICGFLYLAGAVPLLFFPKSLQKQQQHGTHQIEMQNGYSHDHDDHLIASLNGEQVPKTTFGRQLKEATEEFARMAAELLRNPVYASMVIGWMFGSYLTGGYSTYLPKYIETQFGRSASAADMYAGIVSIGSVAFSTALGGYLLTKFNPSPRKALLLLIVSWSTIVVTYLIGLLPGCGHPAFKQPNTFAQ